MEQNSKVLFMCNTSYQLMNAINIVANNYEDVKDRSDIIILDLFEHAGEIANKLSKKELFNSVCLAKRINRKFHNNKIRILLHPQIYIDDFSFSDESVLGKKYDLIFQGDIEPLEMAINEMNAYPKVYLYEDGTGSYAWNDLIRFHNVKYRFFCKLFHCSENAIRVERLLVYEPELCSSRIVKRYDKLIKMDKSNPATKICIDVFGFNPNSLVLNHRFIILDQPLNDVDGFNGYDIFSFIKELNVSEYSFLYRRHPNRAYEPIENDIVDADEVYNMWELECIDNISDDHILISAFSTALTSPKMISGKEPYIIFTYNLLVEQEYIDKLKLYAVHERCKALYSDKTKIFAPESVKDFIEILKSLHEE